MKCADKWRRDAACGRFRAFIALRFDERSTARLVSARERLLDNAAEGRAVPDRDLHMTLAFLGDISADRADELQRIMKRAARPIPLLRADRYGHFGNLYFASVADTPELTATWRELTRSLSASGFRTEERDFIPHVTLARRVRLISSPETPDIRLRPVSLSLMRSELRREGAVYSEISSIGLCGRIVKNDFNRSRP